MRHRLISTLLAATLISSAAVAQTVPSPAPEVAHVVPTRAHVLNEALLNQTVKVIVPGGSGSGTVFNVGNGRGNINVVLTNAHVVAGYLKECADLAMKSDEGGCGRGLPSVTINSWIIRDGKTFPVTYKGAVVMSSIRQDLDLAVILIDKNWPGAMAEPLPTSESIEQSETADVVGSPLGERTQITNGMVSLLDDGTGDSRSMVVSAPIFPGNSGGGLYVERNGKFYFAGVTSAVANIHGQMGFEHGLVVPVGTVRSYLASLGLSFVAN